MRRGVATTRRGLAKDAEAYRECVASVARERRYLVTVEGFSLEDTRAFLQRIEDQHWPLVVALSDQRIVGWCDIIPRKQTGFTHAGTLGMGVREEWRGQGIGRTLIEQCLDLARASGLERIELSVYSDNLPAIRLYESAGFTHEGRKHRARKIDGAYQDELLMALQFEDVEGR